LPYFPTVLEKLAKFFGAPSILLVQPCDVTPLRGEHCRLWSTSLHVFSNCIGCLSAGASRQWVPADRVFAYDHPHRPTTCYHDFALSSASAPFLTLVRLHGTDCSKTAEP